MLHKSTKRKIDEAFEAGQRPQKLKTSEAIALKSGRSTIKLIGHDGKKTPAGEYFEQKEGAPPLPDGGFLQQTARREGNTETIELRNGKRAITRRWNPASNEYKFTALGKQYYSTLRRNYVVDVPVTIRGTRKMAPLMRSSRT